MLNVTVYADANPYVLAHVYAGLCDLAQQKQITLVFSYPWSRLKHKPCSGDLTLWADINEPDSNRSRKVVFDLHDKSRYFRRPRLEECDIYFKRNYYQPDIAQLPVDLGRKIRPFGLNYCCRSPYDKEPILRLLGYFVTKGLDIRKPLASAELFHHTLYLMKLYYSSPQIQGFERQPDQTAEPFILFQTRVWGPDESDDNWIEVNEGRVSIIRALKRAFGSQFIGGLVPDKVALKYYPDCLTSLRTDQRSFIEMSRRSLIGIYTRGLHHSLSFKLPEDLAASKCIVSEPLRNQMPVPLEHEKHYLEYHSPEECVAACQRLLKDPELASEMRHNNFAYYQAEVKPSVHILKCLRHALDEG
jgi:hypothetical protein